ncbi:MAG: DUF2127 domain-containing protein [bacterium]|nr:DUF2127 domain-containing protein [bacterium]
MEILPATEKEREKDILWIFDIGLLLKAVNGGLEIVVAFLVLVIPPSFVLALVEFITGGELTQDPDDPIVSGLVSAAHTFAVHTHYLLAFYLVLHGAVKIILVVGIFRGKKIAYPLLVIALALFGTYEAYRGLTRHEILLQMFAVFDFALLLLTAYEYRRRYSIHPFSPGI